MTFSSILGLMEGRGVTPSPSILFNDANSFGILLILKFSECLIYHC